jgi:hypothetical protein
MSIKKPPLVLELEGEVIRTGLKLSEAAPIIGLPWLVLHRWVRGQYAPNPTYASILRKGLRKIRRLPTVTPGTKDEFSVLRSKLTPAQRQWLQDSPDDMEYRKRLRSLLG